MLKASLAGLAAADHWSGAGLLVECKLLAVIILVRPGRAGGKFPPVTVLGDACPGAGILTINQIRLPDTMIIRNSAVVSAVSDGTFWFHYADGAGFIAFALRQISEDCLSNTDYRGWCV